MRRLLVLLLCCAGAMTAHSGPPFPIITDKPMGPCLVSLWTHPDVGTGWFFVVVSAAPGKTIPKDLKFKIGVLPATGRLKEVVYHTETTVENGETHYNAWPWFDRQELWRINLYMLSSTGNQEASATVEVTPPGFGRWDLLFFSLPFLGVGFLWFMGLKRRRMRRAQRPSSSAAR